MKLVNSNKLHFYISLSLFFMLSFTACNASLFSYSNARVDKENRIALLEGKPRKGSWNTRDLSVNYNYKMEVNVLQLSGHIKFDNQLHKFTSLDHFSLGTYFLNEEGKILGYKAIAVADYHKRVKNISFDHNIEMPPNVNGIAFGYNGRARESGEGAATWDFWKDPHS